MLADVKSGKYTNIRGYNYVPFSQYSHDYPGYSTTAATEDNLGAPWLNVSYMASVHYDGPEDGTKPNYASFRPFSSFAAFGAVCFHFAAALTDKLGADAPPIGLLMSWMGGTTPESWSANESLAMCTDINTGMSGMPVSKLFYGQVTPFVNTTVSGFLWCESPLHAPRTRASVRKRSASAPEAFWKRSRRRERLQGRGFHDPTLTHLDPQTKARIRVGRSWARP